jgi:hypothetical protein
MKITINKALVTCVALLTIAPAAFAQQAKIVMPERGLCAHRGGFESTPENTVPGFKGYYA